MLSRKTLYAACPSTVNAMAKEMTVRLLAEDFSQPITLTLVVQAAHAIIQRRETHMDSLMARLQEARVQRVIEPIIMGDHSSYDWLDDDYHYVLDLGLIRERDKKLEPANPIFSIKRLRRI